MGHSLNIKDTDVKVLGRTVSITTDNTFAAAELLVDESFNPNVKYSGAFEDNSQWTINRLLKSKIDALSDGIPSDINPASTESYGIVRLASGTNDPDDYDVVTMNLFRPVYGDVENNKTRLAKLEECCEEVQEFIKKKDVAVINRIPNTTLSDEVWSEDGKSVTFKITADTGYYISDVDIDGLDIDVELTPNDEDYPTEYTVVITSDNEIEYDIYVDGISQLIPTQSHTITVKGTGVKTQTFVVGATQADYLSALIGPVTGYQVADSYLSPDTRSSAIKYLPALQNVQVVFSPHLTLDLFRVSVTGTLDQDVVIDTTDLYTKITGTINILESHCDVMLSAQNGYRLNPTVKYGEDISGTFTVMMGYYPTPVKAVWRYYDEDGQESTIESDGRDIELNSNHFIIHNPGWDVINDTSSTTLRKKIRQVDLIFVAAIVQTCSITYNGSNYNTTNNATQVVYGDSYSTTITPTSGYKIDSVTVTMNGTPINQAWDRTTGKLTIDSVTGPVVITVSTSSNVPQTVQYNVTYQYSGLVRGNVNFGGNNGQPINVVTSGNKYNCTIVPQSGYHISSATIKTTSGGQVVASTYTNNILKSTNNITEDITVTITGGVNKFYASLYPTGGFPYWNTGDMPVTYLSACGGNSYLAPYPSKGWAIIFGEKVATDVWWGNNSEDYSLRSSWNPTKGYYYAIWGHKYGRFATNDNGGTGKLKIMNTTLGWKISCESHYIDIKRGFAENGSFGEDALLERVVNNTLSECYMDDLYGLPNKLTFNKTTGTGADMIQFTATPNTGRGAILHTISIEVVGGISATYEKFTKFYVAQDISAQQAKYRSYQYAASPYSSGESMEHKFIGSWKRVLMDEQTGVITGDAPATDLDVEMDYSGHKAHLSSNSGDVNTTLTITSSDDYSPDTRIDDRDRANEVRPKAIYFLETFDGEDPKLIKFLFNHSFDESAVDMTPLILEDSTRTDNYISEVKINSDTVVENADPNANIYISGYGKTGTVNVKLNNTDNLTEDDIQIHYYCPMYSEIYQVGYADAETHVNPDLENILWKSVEFQYDSENGVISFPLGTGMMAPCGGTGSMDITQNAPWNYYIILS